MALAFIAATMLVSTVIKQTLDLFDDTEAKKSNQKKDKKYKGGNGGNPDYP